MVSWFSFGMTPPVTLAYHLYAYKSITVGEECQSNAGTEFLADRQVFGVAVLTPPFPGAIPS